MSEIINGQCIIVNKRERKNGSIFIVFMIAEKGFLSGILASELRDRFDEPVLFYEADISFYFHSKRRKVIITELYMKRPAEAAEVPIF